MSESKPKVTIQMSMDEAERLSNGMSDLLCWCTGFSAALGVDDLDREPMGVNQTRDVRIKLMKAMDTAEAEAPLTVEAAHVPLAVLRMAFFYLSDRGAGAPYGKNSRYRETLDAIAHAIETAEEEAET